MSFLPFDLAVKKVERKFEITTRLLCLRVSSDLLPRTRMHEQGVM